MIIVEINGDTLSVINQENSPLFNVTQQRNQDILSAQIIINESNLMDFL